jgi:hypothetical protein
LDRLEMSVLAVAASLALGAVVSEAFFLAQGFTTTRALFVLAAFTSAAALCPVRGGDEEHGTSSGLRGRGTFSPKERP